MGITVSMPCRQSIVCGTDIDLFAIAFVSASSSLQITIGSPYNITSKTCETFERVVTYISFLYTVKPDYRQMEETKYDHY